MRWDEAGRDIAVQPLSALHSFLLPISRRVRAAPSCQCASLRGGALTNFLGCPNHLDELVAKQRRCSPPMVDVKANLPCGSIGRVMITAPAGSVTVALTPCACGM